MKNFEKEYQRLISRNTSSYDPEVYENSIVHKKINKRKAKILRKRKQYEASEKIVTFNKKTTQYPDQFINLFPSEKDS